MIDFQFFSDGVPKAAKATKWDRVLFWLYLIGAGVFSWYFFPGFAGI